MSFAEKFSSRASGISMEAKIIREKAIVYALWLKQKQGRRAYFVVEIESPKHKDFQSRLDSGANLNLNDYGKIIYSGWTEPPESLKAELREKYGLYED